MRVRPLRLESKRSRNRGSVLIVALGILTVLALLAVSFATVMRTERKATLNYADSVRARMAAEAGIEYALQKLQEESRLKNYTDATYIGPGPTDSPNDFKRDSSIYSNYTDIGNPDAQQAWSEGNPSDRWSNLDYQVLYDPATQQETRLLTPFYPSFVSPRVSGSASQVTLPWQQGTLEGGQALAIGGDGSSPPLEAFKFNPSGFVGQLASDNTNYVSIYSKRGATSPQGSNWNGDSFTLKVIDTSSQIYLNMEVARHQDSTSGGTWSIDKKLMGEYEPLFSIMYTAFRHLRNDLPSGFQPPSGSPLFEVIDAMAGSGAPSVAHDALANAKQRPVAPTGLVGATCRSLQPGDETINAAPDGSLIKAILDKRFSLPGGRFTSKSDLLETDPVVRALPLGSSPLGSPVAGRPYGRLLNPEHFEAIKDFFCVQTNLDDSGVTFSQNPDLYKSWVQTPPYRPTTVWNMNLNSAPISLIAGNIYGIAARTYRFDVDGEDNASFTSTATADYRKDLTDRGLASGGFDVFSPYASATLDPIYELTAPLAEGVEDATSWGYSLQRWLHPQLTARRWAVGLPNLPTASQEPSNWSTAGPWGKLGYVSGYFSTAMYPASTYSAGPDDRLAVCSKDLGPIPYDAAIEIAARLVEYRTKVAPFRTYNELRRFLEHGDTFIAWNGIDETWVQSGGKLENAYNVRILEHLDDYGYTQDYRDRLLARMFVDMLMANFAPYVISARKNPDSHMAPLIEKGDLIHFTAPFALGGAGTFEISSLGRIVKLENQTFGTSETSYTVPDITAKREIRTVVKVFERLRMSSQRQFESYSERNRADGTSPSFESQALSWPPLYSETDPGGLGFSAVEERRAARRALITTWPNPLELLGGGSEFPDDSWGFITPTPVGKWHKGNLDNGWDNAGLGDWINGWDQKFGVDFDWPSRDVVDDPGDRVSSQPNYLENPTMVTAMFSGMVERDPSLSANEGIRNWEFPIFTQPAPPFTPYEGPDIPGFEDLMSANWDFWQVEGFFGGPLISPGYLEYHPLMNSWCNWLEEGNLASVAEGLDGYNGSPSQDAAETRQAYPFFDRLSSSIFNTRHERQDRSNANPDGFFIDWLRRAGATYWASNPADNGSLSLHPKMGFEAFQEATAGATPYQDGTGASSGESFHQNLSFRDGGLEFWVKLDVRGSDPVPCGFFSSIQVTNMDGRGGGATESRADTSVGSGGSPWAALADDQPTGGVAMYIWKDAFGYLRISRIAFEKAFNAPEFEDGNTNLAVEGSSTPPQATQPMPLSESDFLDVSDPVAYPDWNGFEPHNDFGEPGHADGWNYWPRGDVLFDIGDWNAHEWHHLAVGWQFGTILYGVNGTVPDVSWEDVTEAPLLWIDGERVGAAENVYNFGGTGDVSTSGGSNEPWQTEALAAATGGPPPYDPAEEVVQYSLLNYVGPFDHMTVGAVYRRQYRGEDGVYRFFTDGKAANLWDEVDYALWDGYSTNSTVYSFPSLGTPGDPSGQRIGHEPWYRDRGNTVVLPANGTIDSFHTYEDFSQFLNPPPWHALPSRYDEYFYDDMLSSNPPPARNWRQGAQDIYPEFHGCFQFSDKFYPNGVTLGALSWTEIRPREMRFTTDPDSLARVTEGDIALISPDPRDETSDPEGCDLHSTSCGFDWSPATWPDVHMAWAVSYYDAGANTYPDTNVEGGHSSGAWRWIEASGARMADGDLSPPAPYLAGGAQAGIGGPITIDPSDLSTQNERLGPGDRLYWRAIFTSYSANDWDNVAGGNSRLLAMAALVDVTLTVMVDPIFLIWEEKID